MRRRRTQVFLEVRTPAVPEATRTVSGTADTSRSRSPRGARRRRRASSSCSRRPGRRRRSRPRSTLARAPARGGRTSGAPRAPRYGTSNAGAALSWRAPPSVVSESVSRSCQRPAMKSVHPGDAILAVRHRRNRRDDRRPVSHCGHPRLDRQGQPVARKRPSAMPVIVSSKSFVPRAGAAASFGRRSRGRRIGSSPS